MDKRNGRKLPLSAWLSLLALPACAGTMEDQYRLSIDKLLTDIPFSESYTEVIQGSIATGDGGILYKMRDLNSNEYVLVKLDADGNLVRKSSLGNSDGWANMILQGGTIDHGLIFTGNPVRTSGAIFNRVDFVKTDSLGRQLWRKSIRDTLSVKLAVAKETSDFGFILLGKLGQGAQGPDGVFLIRTDSRGNELWRKKYDVDAPVEEPQNVFEKPDGGFLISGRYWDGGFLLRTDPSGQQLWMRSDPTVHYEPTIETRDHHLVGYSTRGGILAKRDSSGTTLWERPFPNTYSLGMVEKPDNGYLINQRDALTGIVGLMSTDSAGNPIWRKQIIQDSSVSGYDEVIQLTASPQGGYYFFTQGPGTPFYEYKTRVKKIDPLFRFEPAMTTVAPGEPTWVAWSLMNNSDTMQTLTFASQAVRAGAILPSSDSALEYRVYHALPHSIVRDSASYLVPSDWEPGSGFSYRGEFKLRESDIGFSSTLERKVDYIEMELKSDVRVLRRLDTLNATAIVRNVSKYHTLHDLNFAVNIRLADSTVVPDSASTGSPYLGPVTTFTLLPGEARSLPIRFGIPASWNSRINFLQAHLQSSQGPGGRRTAGLKFVGED